MRILGIDPGTATVGYGVVDKIGASPVVVRYGTITTSPKQPPPRRLLILHEGLNCVIDEFSPDVIVMEQLFFAKNQTTAIAVGKAVGVLQLVAAQRGIPVVEVHASRGQAGRGWLRQRREEAGPVHGPANTWA